MLLAHARVVYCEALPDGNFCIGLSLQSTLAEFEEYANACLQYSRANLRSISPGEWPEADSSPISKKPGAVSTRAPQDDSA